MIGLRLTSLVEASHARLADCSCNKGKFLLLGLSSTVLHSINKIEAMRRSDEALNRTITRLVGAVVAQT